MVCNGTCTTFAEGKLVPEQFQPLSDGLYSPVLSIHQGIRPLFMETLTVMRLAMAAPSGHSTGDVGHDPTIPPVAEESPSLTFSTGVLHFHIRTKKLMVSKGKLHG